MTGLQFISKIGMSPRSALRNASQSSFIWKWFGKENMQKSWAEIKENGWDAPATKDNPEGSYLTRNMQKYGLEFYDIGTITEGALSYSDLQSLGVQQRGGYLTRADQVNLLDRLSQRVTKVAGSKPMAGMMKWVENWNRKETFKVAFGDRIRSLKKIDKYAQDIEGNRAEMADIAGRYAARVTEFLHYQYAKHGKSELLKSKVGSVLFQFNHYKHSTLALEARLWQDYKKAFKAGDYKGYEFARLRRSAMLAIFSNILSIVVGANVTSYLGNEVLSLVGDFYQFLTGDDEVQKSAFYSKGPLVSQSVVLSDISEIINLGTAAGYWDLDSEGKMALLAGIRDYEKIDDYEFARGITGMTFGELERLVTRSLPSAFKSDTPVNAFFYQEFGLYPGQTELGIDVRQTRKAVSESKPWKGISSFYESATGEGLIKKDKKEISTNERKAAIRSLARF